eukprot:Hpha_TRINITY_DN16881_c1_g1::TRINITY_DN16881_c1_g1_i1::g.149421::m.149421
MISIDWNQAHVAELARKLQGKKPEEVRTLRLDNAVFAPEGLAPLVKLESLSIYPDSEVARQGTLSSIPPLPSLLTLDAPEHLIADIPADAGARWPKLMELNLNNNKFCSADDLIPLKNCADLRSLSLGDNPITKDKTYRTAIFERLPQLTKVDGYNKEGEEYDEIDEDEEEEEEEGEEAEEDAGEADDEAGVNGVRADRPEDTLSGPPPQAAEEPEAKRQRTEEEEECVVVDDEEEALKRAPSSVDAPPAKVRRVEAEESPAAPAKVEAP